MICALPVIGLGVLGLVAFRRAHRCHRYGHRGWGGPPWAHRHGWHGRHRHGLYMALSYLDASPAQERAIIHEVDALRAKLRDTKSGLRDARGDLAAAVRGPVLDDAALGAVLGKLDGATGEARAAVLDAVRNIHAVLDDNQREKLADLLDKGWWRRGGGPYRV